RKVTPLNVRDPVPKLIKLPAAARPWKSIVTSGVAAAVNAARELNVMTDASTLAAARSIATTAPTNVHTSRILGASPVDRKRPGNVCATARSRPVIAQRSRADFSNAIQWQSLGRRASARFRALSVHCNCSHVLQRRTIMTGGTIWQNEKAGAL